MVISASNPLALKRRDQVVGAVHLDVLARRIPHDPAEWIAAVGGAENRAAEVGDAADLVGGEGHDTVVPEQPAEAAANAVGLPAPGMRAEHNGPDDCVEAGGVAAAGGDGDPHDLTGSEMTHVAARRHRIIGRVLDQGQNFARLGVPPEALSWKRPRSRRRSLRTRRRKTSSGECPRSGNACLSSAARPAARGS